MLFVQVRELAAHHGPFDVILGGDLLYRPPVVAPLLGVLSILAGPTTQVKAHAYTYIYVYI